MSTDWLPFYGIALGAFGSLVLALAALIVRRHENERRYQWTIFTGTMCIFLGFMLGALFYIGEKFGYRVALQQYTIPSVVIVCGVFAGDWFITHRRRSAHREKATADLGGMRFKSNMEKAVYFDEGYPSKWLSREHSADLRTRLNARGFKTLSAQGLKTWMLEKIGGKTAGNSSIVFSQDVVPDTIFPEGVDCANVLLRQYLDEGGRVVWLGDIPLWYRGLPNQIQEVWQFGVPTAMLGVVPLFADSSSNCRWIDSLKAMKSNWYSMRPINIKNRKNFIGLQVIPLASADVTLMTSSYNISQISRWKKTGTKIKQGSVHIGALGYVIGGEVSMDETFPKELSINESMKLACAWQVRFNETYPTQGFYRILDAQFTELNSAILKDIQILATLDRPI